MKVFIADGSNVGLRRLLALVGDAKEFELVGYSAEATAALVSIRTVRPDLVILDLALKGNGGLRVLKAIKQEMPETFFIVLTNAPSAQYRAFCSDLGVEFFFDKTTEFQKIPGAVSSLAAQLDARRSS
ncbi:MAG TPA: response regulator [Bacteroidota bacterium]|nr:response regulator [Bacteroidota bacterium]